jgi:hypothetical protein
LFRDRYSTQQLKQRLKLLSLERNSLTVSLILDQHSVLLDIGDVEGLLRERSEECSVYWKFLHVVEEIVSRHSKRHTGDSGLCNKDTDACEPTLPLIALIQNRRKGSITCIQQRIEYVS